MNIIDNLQDFNDVIRNTNIMDWPIEHPADTNIITNSRHKKMFVVPRDAKTYQSWILTIIDVMAESFQENEVNYLEDIDFYRWLVSSWFNSPEGVCAIIAKEVIPYETHYTLILAIILNFYTLETKNDNSQIVEDAVNIIKNWFFSDQVNEDERAYILSLLLEIKDFSLDHNSKFQAFTEQHIKEFYDSLENPSRVAKTIKLFKKNDYFKSFLKYHEENKNNF